MRETYVQRPTRGTVHVDGPKSYAKLVLNGHNQVEATEGQPPGIRQKLDGHVKSGYSYPRPPTHQVYRALDPDPTTRGTTVRRIERWGGSWWSPRNVLRYRRPPSLSVPGQ